MRILLNGASGRMGRAILTLADAFPGLVIEALPRDGATLAAGAAADTDVLVDFSVPEGLRSAIECAARWRIPLLSGTTGFDTAIGQALDELAQRVPVLVASNFSLGVAALRRAAEVLAGQLDWDCEIVESHHRLKRDAPSGTALAFAESVRRGRGQSLEWTDRRAESLAGQRRAAGSLGIAAIRGGSVVGDHSVHFLGDGERVELTHRADDRSIFARGAVHAALRLGGRVPGRYRLEEVLWS